MSPASDASGGTRGLLAARGRARWLVCEKTGSWAVALRREPESWGTRIWETRSLGECWEMLDRWGGSFVVAELTDTNLGGLLERLVRLQQDFPLARLAVVAPRSLSGYEPLVCEAGAVWFAGSPRQLGPLAAVAQRHLRQAIGGPQGVAAQVWAGLPWGKGDGG